MHQLGMVNKASADEKIKRVLSARRSFYNAAAALLECDDAYAARIKTELERLKIARYFRPFAGLPYLCEVTADEIQSYLETARRIYLRQEQIVIDAKEKLCRIALNPRVTANIPLGDKVAVKSILI